MQDNKEDKDPLQAHRRTGYVYPTTPSPRTVVQIDEIESVAERLPIRYELLESLLDEFPDSIRETITKNWESKK